MTFDVCQDAVGSYPQRVLGMLIASALFLPLIEGHMLYLAWKDGQLRNWRSALRCLDTQFGRKGVFTRLLSHYFPYYGPNFHPWDADNRSKISPWKQAFAATGDTLAAYAGFREAAGLPARSDLVEQAA